MKRWPVIRHVRALYWAWRAERHYRSWQKVGDFGHAAERDYQHARRIWWGEE